MRTVPGRCVQRRPWRAAFERIRAHDDPALFISLRDEADAVAEAKALQAGGAEDRPLLRRAGRGQGQHRRRGLADHRGVPGLRLQARHATRPRSRGCAHAGAIVIGKTNLDQFATGLVGVRSPYGVPRNAFNPELIPGGSSSGSAVAVGRRARAARARHRHRRLRPRAGRAQQHRRAQAEPRPRLDRRRRAGLPLARLRLGLRADHRRRLGGARRHGGARRGRSLFARAAARRRRRRSPRHCGSACRSRASACSSATRLRQRPTSAAIERAAALGAADRRDRHRAVLRDRAAALRRAVGGGALHRGRVAARVAPGMRCIR